MAGLCAAQSPFEEPLPAYAASALYGDGFPKSEEYAGIEWLLQHGPRHLTRTIPVDRPSGRHLFVERACSTFDGVSWSPPSQKASHTRLRGCALEVYYSHAPAICLTGGATLQRRCYRLAGGGDASPRFVLVTYAFSVSRRRPGAPAPTGPSSGQALAAAECSVLRTRLESVERELFQERETSAELRAQLALAWATTGVRGVMPRTKGVTCDGTAEADAVLVEMRGETSKRSRLEFLLAADADSCCESCLSGVVVAQSPGAEPSLPDWGLDGGARPGKNESTAQEGAAPGVGPL